MFDRIWTRRIALAAAAGGVALALAAAPFAPGAALAKGASDKGAERSGGRAGGNGHGNGGVGGQGGSAPGQVIANSAGGGEDAHGNGHGLARGHDKDAVSGVGVSSNGIHPENHGALASMLGSLNAAHAIANGNTNTNLNSKVGQISAYMEAFNKGDIDAAAANLITASNKDLESMDTDTVEGVVGGVNDLLGDSIDATGSDLADAEKEVAEKISPPPDPPE